MPKFGSVLSSLQAKLEEARVSNLNYELGRFVQDTKCYLSSTFKGPGNSLAGIPKSTSLPVFPAGNNRRVSESKNQRGGIVDGPITGKYKYRSSFRPPSDEDILGSVIGEDIIEEEEEDYDQFSLTESSTVVEKFIRVIESSSNSKFENTTATTNSSNNSEIAASNTNREDIRRKLAFNKPEPTSFEAKAKSNKKNDLEVCYINEIVDTEEESNTSGLPDHHGFEPRPTGFNPGVGTLTRSQSECVSFVHQKIAFQNQADETASSANVAYKLSKCKQDAHRKMIVEKRNRTFHEVNTFNQLIGKSIEGKLNADLLSQMNTATIQVIVNDFHNKIENLNEELVNELMKKDELQIEQDGQLVDIDDLTQDLNRKKISSK